MRQFYSAYRDNPKLQPLVGEISWTKNVIIMQRCRDDFPREFYIRMTKKFGWLPRDLKKYFPEPEEMIKRLEELT